MTHIVSLVGRQGSGKTTIGLELAKKLPARYIETSEIVKEHNKNLPDLELASSSSRNGEEPNWLTEPLEQKIQESNLTTIVLCGVREPHIYEYLQDHGHTLWSVWLFADPFVRFNRLAKQGRVKNVEQFLAREINERELGLREIERVTVYQAETSDMLYPHQTAAAIINFLKEKGLEV